MRYTILKPGCQCPPFWHGIVPPPCPMHNPMPPGTTTTTTNYVVYNIAHTNRSAQSGSRTLFWRPSRWRRILDRITGK
jgi:hypothetical protein